MRLVVLTATLLALAPMGAAQSLLGQASVSEQYLFQSANSEREQRGLKPLRWDESLYRAAAFHARQMATHAGISHQFAGEPELSARGRDAGARFSLIAENVAEAPTAVRVHEAWMNSQGHRDNLLDPRLDSVAIRVERRGGELYAVEDFSRSVQVLSLEEQEQAVAALLLEASPAGTLLGPEVARRTCSMDTGYAGDRQPGFVMRYTTADIQKLPEALKNKLAAGRYRQMAVGACTSRQKSFSVFDIAVLLYP